MQSFDVIIYEKKDGVAWITLNRPDVLNALNDRLREQLILALERARDDDEIRVVVITGAGGKAFCAGGDISEFPKLTPADRLKNKLVRYIDLIADMPKPVIAMVDGLAMGGGNEIAMACDMVVASDNAQFGQPEIKIGVIPGAGGTQRLPRLIGEKKAKELIFTGRPIQAQEALSLGLVNRVTSREKLREVTEELVNDLLKRSPIILRIAKTAVRNSSEMSLHNGLASEKDLFAMCFGTQDQKEGANAFLEKRKPDYLGR